VIVEKMRAAKEKSGYDDFLSGMKTVHEEHGDV
jgi:hypothetical protein